MSKFEELDTMMASEDLQLEKVIEPAKQQSIPATSLLDKHGLPLVPQPTRFRDDPLNWPVSRKWAVLLQVSFMAFLGPFNAAVPNPSLITLAEVFGKSTNEISYSTTIAIIMGGVSPFLFGPLSNIYGRRPVTLFCQLLAVLGAVGAGYSSSYSTLLGTRALAGIGFGQMMAVGTACISDMFYLHERGEKTGVYTIFVTNGAHIAAIGGGYLAQNVSWKYDFFMPAIVTAFSLILAIVAFPETLFSRDPNLLEHRVVERSYRQLLFDFHANTIPSRSLQYSDFTDSFRMLMYKSVSFVVWWYIWCWAFVNVLPALTMSAIYSKTYHFQTGPIGLCLGIPLLIGTLLGELTAGRMSDFILYKLSLRHGGTRIPEHRLYLTTVGAFMMPAGIILFGFCVQEEKQFVIPLLGLTISCYGLQIASTCLYAYVADCYKPQTAETGILMNLSRGLSFCLGFFALPFGESVGYGYAWLTFALILWVFWLPILALMFWGEKWRRSMPPPKIHDDL